MYVRSGTWSMLTVRGPQRLSQCSLVEVLLNGVLYLLSIGVVLVIYLDFTPWAIHHRSGLRIGSYVVVGSFVTTLVTALVVSFMKREQVLHETHEELATWERTHPDGNEDRLG